MNIRRIVFGAGLVIALICAFVPSNILPWLVGGSGIFVGLANIDPRNTRIAFFCLIGLVVALSAIFVQPFNPKWLCDVVFFVRVFVAHILLAHSFVHFWRVARAG